MYQDPILRLLAERQVECEQLRAELQGTQRVLREYQEAARVGAEDDPEPAEPPPPGE